MSKWILPENKMPEPNTRVLATIKHHAWVTDADSAWVPEDEKIVHKEYMETCEAIYKDNGTWEYRDCECAFEVCYAWLDGEWTDYPGSPQDDVMAWKPMPEPWEEGAE